MKDLLSFVVKSVAEIEHVMNVGNQNRSVGATNMNEHSSRSHAIFTIYIECSRKVKFSLISLRKTTSGHISKTLLRPNLRNISSGHICKTMLNDDLEF